MPRDLDNPRQSEDLPYRVYRSGEQPGGQPGGQSGARAGNAPRGEGARGEGPRGDRSRGDGSRELPYRTYRSAPRGLLARLRNEDDPALSLADHGRSGDIAPRRRRGFWRGRWTWRRGLLTVVGLIAAWLLLSLVLFLVSASVNQGSLPASAEAALSSGGNMLTSTDTVLIIGTDQRPSGTHEGGANTRDAGSRSDTIMLWRIGGGVSRRLSIPRDTLAQIPGFGTTKINAAYAYGGPALAIKTVERFTGIPINHMIVINLANFPKFIDDVGGVTVRTGRVCSAISGGVQNGGFTLNLRPGVHHLNGRDALTLARTRHNTCNPAENDITREKRQQQILNGIKSQLFSLHTFLHLPWVAWDAPSVLRSDMGGFTLMSMFAAAELGGSAPVQVLKTSGAVVGGADVLTATPGAIRTARNKLLNG
jgi:LCP family protein required for cell wall assembly